MDDAENWAISYFAARGDVPWRWADDGDVIAWSDGTTIVFREELAFVLEWLIPHGWPPFGALVWLLAACRGKLPPSSGGGDFPGSTMLTLDADGDQLSFGTFRNHLRALQAGVESGLAAVARLPEVVRRSQKAKAVLAETVFGGNESEAGAQSLLRAVVAVLRSGALTDGMLNHPSTPPPTTQGEFKALHEGLIGITAESLALRLRTGLDDLPRAVMLPAAPATRLRAMLADLRTDPEHAGLARLTRDFMAALQLPRLLAEPDEMPLGGFADLSNRGSLDRLLLSELAHDDLTLAVRIALQEALYLRREPPAKQPPSTLAVLLDSGVRVWGVPRLLATAVALALIGKSSQHGKLAAFRASGDTVAEVDLLSREGLTAHLSALETQAHPGAALAAFRRAVDVASRHDAVLITQRDVIRDPAFQRSLLAAKFDALYLAVVDRDGGFELFRAPHTGTPLCRAQVNVDDLLPSPPSRIPARSGLINRAANADLPVIFSTSPFPLLISVCGKVQSVSGTGEEAGLCVMRDRRLMQWRGRGCGASMVTANLPSGVALWLGELPDGSIGVVKAHGRGRHVACRIFEPKGALLHSHDWDVPYPAVRAEAHGGVLFLICTREARVYDLASGAHLGSIRVSRRLSHGRYFLTAEGWCILVWDGQAARLESVPLPSSVLSGSVIRVFTHRGHEGPWCLTRSGELFSGDGARVLRLGPLRDVATVSPDGRHLLVVKADTGQAENVDLLRVQYLMPKAPSRVLDEWRVWPPPHVAVRTRLTGIAVSPGQIRLVSGKGVFCELNCGNGRLELLRGEGKFAVQALRFEPVDPRPAAAPSLKAARWPDGRCAWLDRHGMLHLRCADRTRPEVSLVLRDGGLAAWTSDGLWYGSKFFIGDHESSPISEIWRRIQAFTE